MGFAIPGAILAALASSLLVPVYFLMLSRGPFRVGALGNRYRGAVSLLVLVWIGLGVLLGRDSPTFTEDMVAGGLIVAAASMAMFNAWALLCWGFTLSMMSVLWRAGRPLSLDVWILEHSGGPIEAFADNRLKVLLGMDLARRDANLVRLTPLKGRMMARLDCLARRWHGGASP